MVKKPASQADKSAAAAQALMTPQILPDTAAQTLPAGKRAYTLLEPKDDALQEDLAALLGDDIGAGQAERVLLAQAQPGVPSDTDKGAGAGSTDAGAGAGTG
ncbi:MAG: hypothetical protein Q8K18_13940, partial [Burkholderiales bacterium]|nr:hypothetical protein [Burkholderiales bacterium]